jgi:DNA-binding protein HU-beta
MTKAQVVDRIVKDTGITKTAAKNAVRSLTTAITLALKKGQSVTFVGFGTFKTARRKARTARNPLTGATVKVPRRTAVRFVAGKALKHAVN